jgi:hypothetical protein
LVEPSARDRSTVKTGNAVLGENAGKEAAEEAANAVNAEAVKSVVVAELVFGLDGKVAEQRGQGSDCESGSGRNEAGSGRDADETGDGAGAVADERPLAFADVVEERPDTASGGRGEVGAESSHGGAVVGSESRATVESELSKRSNQSQLWINQTKPQSIPTHPNQSMPVPRAMLETECGLNSWASPCRFPTT